MRFSHLLQMWPSGKRKLSSLLIDLNIIEDIYSALLLRISDPFPCKISVWLGDTKADEDNAIVAFTGFTPEYTFTIPNQLRNALEYNE